MFLNLLHMSQEKATCS